MATTTANGRIKIPTDKAQQVTIAAPNLCTAAFTIRGTAPYVQHKFSAKAKAMLHDQHERGQTARKSKKEPRDFKAQYEGAKHISEEGWCGIPAPTIRAACISACRLVNFKMTLGKLSIFVLHDGFDNDDFCPLVRITKGEPQYLETLVRNATGVADLRARPMWKPGWEAVVRIRFDADQFTLQDVANLLARVGAQVGIGEGRPDSPSSTGLGWGLFEIVGEESDA